MAYEDIGMMQEAQNAIEHSLNVCSNIKNMPFAAL